MIFLCKINLSKNLASSFTDVFSKGISYIGRTGIITLKFLFLKKSVSSLPESKVKTKGPKYVPLARRGDKPDAIAWIVKNHPEVKNNQISKLIGTTKDTIEKIRTRSHWNISNITAKHPVLLSLCSQDDLENAIVKAGGSIETNSDES